MQRWIDRLFISQAVQNGRKHRKSSDEEIWRTVTEGNNKGKKYAIETETGEITKGLGGQLTGTKVGEQEQGESPVNTAEQGKSPTNNGEQGETPVNNVVEIQKSDVTQEYRSKATPGKGSITREEGFKPGNHKAENEMADMVFKEFGGNIKQLGEKPGAKAPDYIWNGKMWELKTPVAVKGVDGLVRTALKQIKANPGGIIVDCRSFGKRGDCESVVLERIRRSLLDMNVVDVMYVDKDGFSFARYKK